MQPSELESLAFETLQIVKRNDSRIKISKTLRQFLKEESIIARTQNCKTYFKSHLNALAANLNVTIIFLLYCKDAEPLYNSSLAVIWTLVPQWNKVWSRWYINGPPCLCLLVILTSPSHNLSDRISETKIVLQILDGKVGATKFD